MVGKIASLIFFLILAPTYVSAQVVISEIMYDVAGTDTDREWIEVQNTGSESVDLTQWKFFESSSNHGLTAYQGGETLAPGAYAVIVDSPAKFLTDWPSFSGQVFDSSFALNNTGETLVLRCCGKDLTDRDSVTYNATGGGAGDGLSLHRSGSSIIATQPSPGSGAISALPPKVEPSPSNPKTESSQPSAPTPQPVVQKTEVMQPEEKRQESLSALPTATASETVATVPEPTVIVQEEHLTPPKKKKSKAVVEKALIEDEEQDEIEEVVEKVAPVSPQVAAVAAQNTRPSSDFLWWTGAAAISLFGAGGAYIAGRSQRKKEWQIEEME